MGNSNGRFVDNDPYVQSQQTLTAVNNDAEFHVAIEEANQVRATQLNITNVNINRVQATPFPTTSIVGQNTTSAALAGIDQPPVAPDDEIVNPCFLGNIPMTYWDGEELAVMPISRLAVFKERPFALSFDENNNQVKGKILHVHCKVRFDYLHVTFEDQEATDVAPEHRYWTPQGYVEIQYLLRKYVYNIKNQPVKVINIDRVEVRQGIPVFNLSIEGYENYVANGHRVHNLKRDPNEQQFNQ